MAVVIPKDWKELTGTDTDPAFRVQTTLSIPSGFTFGFSGSEWSICNEACVESWDYLLIGALRIIGTWMMI
jgi:hypothetical protein